MDKTVKYSTKSGEFFNRDENLRKNTKLKTWQLDIKERKYSLQKESMIISFMMYMLSYIGDMSKSIFKLDKSFKIFIIENSYHFQ